MKISNQKISPLLQLFYSILGLSIFGFFLFLFLGEFNFSDTKLYLCLGLAILLIIVLKTLGKPYFNYDSDGETINISNKKFSLLPNNLNLVNRAEFPKEKLQSFKIKTFLFSKKLELYLHSKKAHKNISKIKYDISYLNSKSVSDLKKSLNKIVNENKNNISVEDEN